MACGADDIGHDSHDTELQTCRAHQVLREIVTLSSRTQNSWADLLRIDILARTVQEVAPCPRLQRLVVVTGNSALESLKSDS